MNPQQPQAPCCFYHDNIPVNVFDVMGGAISLSSPPTIPCGSLVISSHCVVCCPRCSYLTEHKPGYKNVLYISNIIPDGGAYGLRDIR